MALLIDPVVTLAIFFHGAGQFGDDILHLQVEVSVIFGLTGDDQRRPRLVDQNRVDFIDDGKIQAALHPLTGGIDHVVAQVIETKLVIGAVGNIRGISRLLGLVVHLREIDADTQAEEAMQPPHPFRIAAGQVVIDRNNVNTLAGNRIQVGGQGADQGLALAGTHFGNLAVVQDHAADQLGIEVAHAELALRGFANHGKGFRQEIIERLTLGMTLTEFIRLSAQGLVAQPLQGRLKRIDAAHRLGILFNQPVVAAAENLFE